MADCTPEAFAGPSAADRSVALLLAARARDPRGFYPTIPRLRTLLACRLWHPADARFWADATGRVVAFAGLFPPASASDFLPLTFFAHPEHVGTGLAAEIFGWALDRARQRTQESVLGAQAALYIQAPDTDHALQDTLTRMGFAQQPVQLRYLLRPLAERLPEPTFPAGFTLHPVPASPDLDRYRDRYRPLFARWSIAERRRLMASPDYDPSLALVVEDQDGTLAAYCECAISRTEWAHGGPRAGWIDIVATNPALRRRGLGRAILHEALRRLRSAGATTAHLFTESSNAAALPLYDALGFRHERVVRLYSRSLTAPRAS